MSESFWHSILAPVRNGLIVSGVLVALLAIALLVSAFRERKRSANSSVRESDGQPRDASEPASGGPAKAGWRFFLGLVFGSLAVLTLVVCLVYVFMTGFSSFEGTVESKAAPHATRSGVYQTYYVLIEGEKEAVPYELYRMTNPGDLLKHRRLTAWHERNGELFVDDGKLFFLGLMIGGGLLIWLAFSAFVFKFVWRSSSK